MLTLSVDNVPNSHKEQFILKGYRAVPNTFKASLLSAFRPHNELLNFWTHFLPAVDMTRRMFEFVSISSPTPTVVQKVPMILFQFAIIILFLTSSFAHLLNCVSFRVRHICFSCDYSAILYYTISAALVHSSCVVAASIWDQLVMGPDVYLALCISIGFTTLWMTCQTRLPNAKRKYLYRTLSFAVPFFTCNYPVITLVMGEESTYYMQICFQVHVFSLLIGAIFNITKIPERFSPGTFDYVCLSHHFMHVGTVIGVYAHYFLVEQLFKTHYESRYNYIHLLAIFFTVTLVFILYLTRFSKRFIHEFKPSDYY